MTTRLLLPLAALALLLLLLPLPPASADPNPSCGLLVPPNPLTAAGLSTPYQLVALDPTQGPCNMSTTLQQAFVNAVVLDLDTGALSAYNPLVIDAGSSPAVPPVVPTLPTNNIVAIFVGSNSQAYGTAQDTLTLLPWSPAVNSLVQGNCILGSLYGNQPDYFGQFSFCNSVGFFAAAHSLIAAKKITVPPLKLGKDGQPCPTSRSFDLVDDNQSDTVVTSYLLTSSGTVAQDNSANRAALPAATVIDNLSDEILLVSMSDALGCSPWQIPDQTNNNILVSNFATDELQATFYQPYPMAQVPALDNNVINSFSGDVDLIKLNSYRLGVGQSAISDIVDANMTFYCQALASVGSHRFASAKSYWSNVASPDPTSGTNLFTFLADRFQETFTSALGDNGLNCTGVLNIPSPITCTYNSNQVCTSATVSTIDPLGAYKPAGRSLASNFGPSFKIVIVLVMGLVLIL